MNQKTDAPTSNNTFKITIKTKNAWNELIQTCFYSNISRSASASPSPAPRINIPPLTCPPDIYSALAETGAYQKVVWRGDKMN